MVYFLRQRQSLWKTKMLTFYFCLLLIFGSGCAEMDLNSLFGFNLASPNAVSSNFEITYANVSLSYPGSKNYFLPHWSELEKSKIYHIRLCLRENVTQNRIIGHWFQVLNEEQTHQIILTPTDEQGCIPWEEEISHNFFSPSKRIPFTRVIRPVDVGIYRGEVKWTYAINLWSENRGEGEQNPFDTFNGTWNSSIENLEGEKTKYELVYKPNANFSLDIQDLPDLESIQVVEDHSEPILVEIRGRNFSSEAGKLSNSELDRIRLKYTLNLEIQTRLKDRFNRSHTHTLETGKYAVKAILLGEVQFQGQLRCVNLTPWSDEYIHSFHDEVKGIRVQGREGQLSVDIDLDWNYTLRNLQSVYLHLVVEPKDLPEGLQLEKSERFYILGSDHNDILSDKTDDLVLVDLERGDSKTCDPKEMRIVNLDPQRHPSENDLSYLDQTFGLRPIKAFNLNFEKGAKFYLQEDHDESSFIKKIFFKTRLCFSSDVNLGLLRTFSEFFSLISLDKIHDQRFLLREGRKGDNKLVHFPQPDDSGPSSNTSDFCIELMDRFRYRHFKLYYNRLVMYRAKVDFSHYTPVLFFKISTKNSPKIETVDTFNDFMSLNLPQDVQSLRPNFIEENEDIVSEDRYFEIGLDRFLNLKIENRTSLSIEPRISFDSLSPVYSPPMRSGFYLVQAAVLERRPKIWKMSYFNQNPSSMGGLSIPQTNANPLEDKTERISTFQGLIYMNKGEKIMKRQYSFLTDPKASRLVQNLFLKYKPINEKKVTLAYYLAKIYGLIQDDNLVLKCLENKKENKKNLCQCQNQENCPDWTINSSSFPEPLPENFLKAYESTHKLDEVHALLNVLNVLKTAGCGTKEVCKNKMTDLSYFLEELSQPISLDSRKKRGSIDLEEFLKNFSPCASGLYKWSSLCPSQGLPMRGTWYETVKSVLGLPLLTDNQNNLRNLFATKDEVYAVIDDFYETKQVLRKYLAPISLKKKDEDHIVLLLLKIIHDNYNFYSSIQNRKYRFKALNVSLITDPLEKLFNQIKKESPQDYKRIFASLYRGEEEELHSSPTYLSPFIFSKHLSARLTSPLYRLDELEGEITEKTDSSNENLSLIPLALDDSQDSIHYYFDRHQVRNEFRFYEQLDEEQTGCVEDLARCVIQTPELLNSLSFYKQFDEEQTGCVEDLAKCATQTPELLNSIKPRKKSYMRELFDREKELKKFRFLSMCYGMLRDFEVFDIKHISFSPSSSGSDPYPSIKFLDSNCKSLLIEELARIHGEDFQNLKFDIEKVLKGNSEDPNSSHKIGLLAKLKDCIGPPTEPDLKEKISSCLVDHFTYDSTQFLSELNSFEQNQGFTRPHTRGIHQPPNHSHVLSFINEFDGKEKKIKTLNHSHVSSFISEFDGKENKIKGQESQILFPKLCFHLTSKWVGPFSPPSFVLYSDLYNSDFYKVLLSCLHGFWMLREEDQSSRTLLNKLRVWIEQIPSGLNLQEPPFLIGKQYRIYELGETVSVPQPGEIWEIELKTFTSTEYAYTVAPHSLSFAIQIPRLSPTKSNPSSTPPPFPSSTPVRPGSLLSWLTGRAEYTATQRFYPALFDWDGQGIPLRVEWLKYDVEIKDYEECLVIQKNPKYAKWRENVPVRSGEEYESELLHKYGLYWPLVALQSLPHESSLFSLPPHPRETMIDVHVKKEGASFMFCERKNVPKTVRENFFYIEGKFSNDYASLSRADPRNRPWSMLVRTHNFFSFFSQLHLTDQRFENILSKATKRDLDSPSKLIEMTQIYQTLFATQNVIFLGPGTHKEQKESPYQDLKSWWCAILREARRNEGFYTPDSQELHARDCPLD